MFRGHVPAIQAGKAHAIVSSAGKKKGTALRVCLLAKCAYFVRASDRQSGRSAADRRP
jgi:hypothetical protein